ncbi:unnamed protein product, partial [Aphanomyces euteiches]
QMSTEAPTSGNEVHGIDVALPASERDERSVAEARSDPIALRALWPLLGAWVSLKIVNDQDQLLL